MHWARGHSFKLYESQCNQECSKHYFHGRVIQKWNNLPGTVVYSLEVNGFKEQLGIIGRR